MCQVAGLRHYPTIRQLPRLRTACHNGAWESRSTTTPPHKQTCLRQKPCTCSSCWPCKTACACPICPATNLTTYLHAWQLAVGALHRLRRLADTKAQLTKLDKHQLAKVDEACAEIEANSKLLVLIQEDLTHVFLRVRQACSDASLCAVAQHHTRLRPHSCAAPCCAGP